MRVQYTGKKVNKYMMRKLGVPLVEHLGRIGKIFFPSKFFLRLRRYWLGQGPIHMVVYNHCYSGGNTPRKLITKTRLDQKSRHFDDSFYLPFLLLSICILESFLTQPEYAETMQNGSLDLPTRMKV